jgi:hypothetical protein
MKAVGIVFGQLLALPLIAGPAHAAQAHHQRFILYGRVEAPSLTLVASGAINGTGSLTAKTVEYQQSDRTYHETDLAAVGNGTLTLSVTGVFDTWPFTLDPRTCTQHGALAGKWSVIAAGGALAGTTGSGVFSGRFLTYADREPSGCAEAAIKGFVVGPMTGSLTNGP